jgi:hypothetical protein
MKRYLSIAAATLALAGAAPAGPPGGQPGPKPQPVGPKPVPVKPVTPHKPVVAAPVKPRIGLGQPFPARPVPVVSGQTFAPYHQWHHHHGHHWGKPWYGYPGWGNGGWWHPPVFRFYPWW